MVKSVVFLGNHRSKSKKAPYPDMIQRQSQQRPHHHKAQRHDDDAANSMLETFFNGPVVFMRNQIDVNDSSSENEKCGDALEE